jgi:lipopolysaccharide export system permease protein
VILDRLKRATWMRLDLLDRWLLKELLGPLLFFIALFTLLLLTGGVMFELVRQMVDKNLPITIAVQVLLFSIPRWLAFSVPIGTLMASLFVFTRLSANSELTALRSLGITTVRMISAALASVHGDDAVHLRPQRRGGASQPTLCRGHPQEVTGAFSCQ